MRNTSDVINLNLVAAERAALMAAGILGLRTANTTAAAQFLGVAPGTMRNWRAAGEGPAYENVGRTGFYVRYSIPHLVAFKRKLEPAG